jgi:3-oxoacid CoA-transferase
VHLIAAVRDSGARDLVVVTNSLGREPTHPVALVSSGQVRKLVAAFSARPRGVAGAAQSISPAPLEVELVPQGLLVERLRAAGAGLGPFYSPVGEDTILADGKERREFGGQRYVLEEPLRLDYALIYARTADRAGNLAFRGANRNFAPSFAKAARVVIAEVDELVEAGDLAPDQVDLPGIFVDRVVRSPAARTPRWPVPRPDDERRDYLDRPGLPPADVAARIGAFVADGALLAPDGALPFNTDGGGLCNNHPTNRGGMTKVIEAVRQLRDEANAPVELDEGPRLMTNIVGAGDSADVVGELAVGLPVEVVFHDTGEGSALPRFRPRAN